VDIAAGDHWQNDTPRGMGRGPTTCCRCTETAPDTGCPDSDRRRSQRGVEPGRPQGCTRVAAGPDPPLHRGMDRIPPSGCTQFEKTAPEG